MLGNMVVKLNLIAAVCENMGIGMNGTLPWRLKKEMNYFTKMTSLTKDPAKMNAVIMGRKSWDSIPEKYRPLPNRISIVLSRDPQKLKDAVPAGVVLCGGMDEAVKYIENEERIENAWVIGGSQIYKMAMEHPNCYRIYYTDVRKYFECDTFFPVIDLTMFKLLSDHGELTELIPTEKQVEGDIEYYFKIYERI